VVDSAGPATGDVGAAEQWNVNIARNGSWQLSKTVTVTPEPTVMGMFILGVTGLLMKRRRRTAP
jgi:hypothetical protein